MKLTKIIATGVIGLSLLTGTTYASPAWQLPQAGKTFATAEAKDAYVADCMGNFSVAK